MRKHGSITVFLSLIIVLTASVIGAVLEAARWKTADCEIRMRTDLGTDSLFAEYHRELLEHYDILFLEGSFGTGNFSREGLNAHLEKYLREAEQVRRGTADLLKISLDSGRLAGYVLATDRSGEAFKQQAVAYEAAGRGNIEQLMGWLDDYDLALNGSSREEDFEREKSSSEDELNEWEKKNEESGYEMPDSPMDEVEEYRKLGILNLAMKDTSKVSGKKISNKGLVSTRKLRRGTMTREGGNQDAVLADIYFTEYILDHFPNALESDRGGSLDYEAEYILMGRYSDMANLEAVALRILLLREGANYVFLMGDSGKQAEAYAMAATIAGALGLPAFINAVQKGLLLAWSFAESVSDLRILFDGGRVPVLKTAASWKTSLKNMGKDMLKPGTDDSKAKGSSYKDYLRLLFYAGAKKDYPLRCMDLMEGHIRKDDKDRDFRMDNCIVYGRVETEWSSRGAVLPFPGDMLPAGKELNCGQDFGYGYGYEKEQD